MTPVEGGAIATERAACPLCGAAAHHPLYPPAAFAPYGVVRCDACRFVFLSPRPPERALRAIYESGAYYEASGDEGYASYDEQEEALRLTFRRVMRTLARRGLTGGDLLEVGCGFGFLLDEARGHFARRHGTEMSPQAAAAAAKRADHVEVGDAMQAPRDATYNVVLSSQVIEHAHRPVDFLADQLARLRPGGALVVATPWMGSPWQRVLGSRWPSFKVPEHVCYFDRAALHGLLERIGLVGIERLPWPHAFPLSLVAAKFGASLPDAIGRRPVWIPGTTLAMVGRKPLV